MAKRASKRQRPNDDLPSQPHTTNGVAGGAAADDDRQDVDDYLPGELDDTPEDIEANRLQIQLHKEGIRLARFLELKGNLAEEVFNDHARRIAGIDGARQDLLLTWMRLVYQQFLGRSRDAALELAARITVMACVDWLAAFNDLGAGRGKFTAEEEQRQERRCARALRRFHESTRTLDVLRQATAAAKSEGR